MKARYSKPSSIEDYIDDWVKNLPFGKRLKEQMPVLYWKQIVGKEITKRTKPLKVEDGVLFVEVDDVLWKRELIMHTKELLVKFSKIGFHLKGIRFVGGI